MNNINIDCKKYIGFKPCPIHKEDLRQCKLCSDYQPVEAHILVVKLDALGDVLRTTSILPALKKKYPNSSITWITKKNAIELLESNSYIDRLLEFEGNYLQYILNEKFDIGICLDADPKSATILSLANCKKKCGFICNESGKPFPINEDAVNWHLMGIDDIQKKANRKTYQQHSYSICQLEGDIYRPQLVLTNHAKEFSKHFKEKHDLSKYKKIIGVNTGGGNRWQMKKWIGSYYVELINLLNKKYPEIGIMLFGGPEEIEFNLTIREKLSNFIVDTECNNSLQNFAALVNLTDIFFTPDSLGMHISIALEKTTIVIVGPTSPWELDVYGKGEIIFNENLSCIACYRNKCNKQQNCMSTISPSMIFNKISNYL